MKPIKVGLLGLGTVGGGTLTVLRRNQQEITRRAGREIQVTMAAVRDLKKAQKHNGAGLTLTADPFEVVDNPDIDIVVELIGGLSPAKELVMKAIENGKHVVTANKALLAVQAMPGNLSTRLLRDVLSDPTDDLRLTAYGMLDKGEKEINERIRDALKKLDDPQQAGGRIELHQQLAGHYWELVYQGYAQGELRRFALRAAWRHAQEAVQADPGSADVWMLAGRIAAAQHDQAAAQHAFQRAQALAMPHSRIRPYLAELAFQKRDFDAVRQHLQGIGRHEINFSTAPLLAFWRQART